MAAGRQPAEFAGGNPEITFRAIPSPLLALSFLGAKSVALSRDAATWKAASR
jgi:hypothetical protein